MRRTRSTSRCLAYTAMAATTLGLALAGSAAAERVRIDPITCSAHFEARAEWLRDVGGNPITVDMMERHAELLWLSVPRDWGMQSWFGERPRSPPGYRKEWALVLDLMTRWAEEGHGASPLPLCMEDEACSRCTRLLQTVVR